MLWEGRRLGGARNELSIVVRCSLVCASVAIALLVAESLHGVCCMLHVRVSGVVTVTSDSTITCRPDAATIAVRPFRRMGHYTINMSVCTRDI